MCWQAMDRAHRIGQKKEVQVFRLCVENSVEEKVRPGSFLVQLTEAPWHALCREPAPAFLHAYTSGSIWVQSWAVWALS